MSDQTEIVAKMRLLEADHKPDGWPAVQMRDISMLCNMIEKDRDRLENDGITCYEGKDGYALVDKAQYEAMKKATVHVARYKLMCEGFESGNIELRSENARLREQVRISDRACATATVALVEAVLNPQTTVSPASENERTK